MIPDFLRNESNLLGRPYLIVALLAISIAFYVILAGTTVGLINVQYDEFTDLLISSSLNQWPLVGNSLDASQARLPMYATAAAYRILQWFNPDLELLDVLPASRWISITMSVLSIIGTFILGYRLFDSTTGVIAAALFSFSPYTLQFGRDALTQGDAFTSTTVVISLIAFERFEGKRNTIWLAIFSLCLALAIASKFFLAILIPALITFDLVLQERGRSRISSSRIGLAWVNKGFSGPWRYVLLAGFTGTLSLLALVISYLRSDLKLSINWKMYQASEVIWLLTLVGIVLSIVSSLNILGRHNYFLLEPSVEWQPFGAWLAILPLAFAATLALFPAHIFNPDIITLLKKRLVTWDSNGFLTTTLSSWKLYLGILLFKLGLPFGVATGIAFVWAARKSSQNKWILMIALIIFYYGILISILPLQQPYWLMSVYPLITLLLSAMIVETMKSLKNNKARIGLVGSVGFAFGWLIVGLFRVYPTFGYYGYELVGEQWLGSDSRGYRSLVVVTNDGSTEAIDWIRQNASVGSTVLSYLDDAHIINYLNQRQPFAFDLRHASEFEGEGALAQELSKADFVIVRVIDDFGVPSPRYDSAFIQEFGATPAHQIFRGRGIYQMPVIQIYKRN